VWQGGVAEHCKLARRMTTAFPALSLPTATSTLRSLYLLSSCWSQEFASVESHRERRPNHSQTLWIPETKAGRVFWTWHIPLLPSRRSSVYPHTLVGPVSKRSSQLR
jgi:hypothetical protein